MLGLELIGSSSESEGIGVVFSCSAPLSSSSLLLLFIPLGAGTGVLFVILFRGVNAGGFSFSLLRVRKRSLNGVCGRAIGTSAWVVGGEGS